MFRRDGGVAVCWFIWWTPRQQLSLVCSAFMTSRRHHFSGYSSVLSRCSLGPRQQHPRPLQPATTIVFSSSGTNDHDEEQLHVVNGETFSSKASSIVYDFCQKVQDVVTSHPPELVSLVLQGSTRFKDVERQEKQRGSIRQVQGRLIRIPSSPKKKEEVMLQLTFKYHGATDICKNLPLTTVHPKQSQNQAIAQTLMTIFYPSHLSATQESQSTMALSTSSSTSSLLSLEEISSEWGLWSHDAASNSPFALQSAHLTLSNGTSWKLRLGSKAPPRLEKSNVAASKTTTTTNTKVPPLSDPKSPQGHDRVKSVLIASSASFLQALGVTNEQGQPKNGVMASKLRQCQKFVEIASRLITTALEQQQRTTPRTTLSSSSSSSSSSFSSTSPMIISTTDMGCGRGYLTFALHSYLMQQYGASHEEGDARLNDSNHHLPAFNICTKGIDVRPKLVQEISQIAQSLGPNFEGLTFETGSIDSNLGDEPITDGASSPMVSAHPESADHQPTTISRLEVLIALHACDTATDDALWWGISRQVNVIVVAPCCHKQVRPQLNQLVRQYQQQQQSASRTEPLLEILRHGIYRERMAETLTDSMRALLLEVANYQVQVFEFIGGEDTSKNIMITAVRRSQPRTDSEQQQLRRRLDTMAVTYGIRQQQLALKMGIELANEASFEQTAPNNGMMPRRRTQQQEEYPIP